MKHGSALPIIGTIYVCLLAVSIYNTMAFYGMISHPNMTAHRRRIVINGARKAKSETQANLSNMQEQIMFM